MEARKEAQANEWDPFTSEPRGKYALLKPDIQRQIDGIASGLRQEFEFVDKRQFSNALQLIRTGGSMNEVTSAINSVPDESRLRVYHRIKEIAELMARIKA